MSRRTQAPERVVPEIPPALDVHLRRVFAAADDPSAMEFAIKRASLEACVTELKRRRHAAREGTRPAGRAA